MTVQENIAKVYVGYFGRSPEPEGFDYWISEANRGFTLSEIAASFSVQDESTSRYPYLANPNVADPEKFVISVYQNLFNRDPEQEGLDYWVGKLNEANGNPDAVGAMVLDIINGAQNTDLGQDKTIIENKTAVALDWAQRTAEISDFEYTDEAAASAKSVLDDVVETDASVAAGKAETDAFIAGGAGQTGETITLTPLVDSGEDFAGSDGNDLFLATGDTLNTGDQLNGGEGQDTLSVQAGVFQSIVATPRLTSIEEVEIQGGANNLFAQFDFTTSTGVEMGSLEGVSGTVQFVGVAYPFDLNVSGSSTPVLTPNYAPTTALSVGYTATSVLGDDDTQKLVLTNSGLADLDIAGIENVHVTATGLNAVTAFDQSNSLTVDGTGDLISSFFVTDEIATFDSTASSGNMYISFGGNTQGGTEVVARAGSGNDVLDFTATGVVDVTSGAGDDYLSFAAQGSLTESDTVDGGDGKDTLVVDKHTFGFSDIVNGTSGMEVLMFQDAFSGINVSDYTQIDEFVFNGGPNGSQVSISGIQSEDRLVFTSDQGNSDKTLNLSADAVGETLFLELRALPNGTLAPDLSEVTDGNVEIVADASPGNDVAAVYLDEEFSAVTIASTGDNEFANVIEAIDTGSENYYAFGNDDGPSTFKIIGNQALTIAAREGTELTSSSDQRGFEEAVNVDASEFSGVLRIALSNGADVFVGGTAGDIIYGLGGDDRLTGNEGADQFRFVGSNGEDTILDFVMNEDKIGFNDVDFQNTTASYEGETLDVEDYVENRDGITSIGTADDDKMIELQEALSTAQIETDEGANVEAYVLVYNSTSERAEIWHDSNWSDDNNRDLVATLDTVVDLAGVQSFSNTDFVEFVA